LLLLVLLLAAPAHADLYRWVDPDTGSIRYSNLPPVWAGEAPGARTPEVVVIPSPRAQPAAPEVPTDAPRKPAPPLLPPQKNERPAPNPRP
jgi:hypothetical protein